MTVINPFDFFVEPYAEILPVRLRPTTWPATLRAYLEPEDGGPLLGRLRRRHRAERQARPSISWSSSMRELQQQVRYVIRMEPGVQTPRRDPGARLRLLPRQRLAAGADAAPSGPRRALRLRLPDPAEGRHRAARRAAGHATRTSPTCTPGPRSICPAPAGSASTPPPACCAARATCRWPPRPHYRSAAPITGAGRARPRSTSTSR